MSYQTSSQSGTDSAGAGRSDTNGHAAATREGENEIVTDGEFDHIDGEVIEGEIIDDFDDGEPELPGDIVDAELVEETEDLPASAGDEADVEPAPPQPPAPPAAVAPPLGATDVFEPPTAPPVGRRIEAEQPRSQPTVQSVPGAVAPPPPPAPPTGEVPLTVVADTTRSSGGRSLWRRARKRADAKPDATPTEAPAAQSGPGPAPPAAPGIAPAPPLGPDPQPTDAGPDCQPTDTDPADFDRLDDEDTIEPTDTELTEIGRLTGAANVDRLDTEPPVVRAAAAADGESTDAEPIDVDAEPATAATDVADTVQRRGTEAGRPSQARPAGVSINATRVADAAPGVLGSPPPTSAPGGFDEPPAESDPSDWAPPTPAEGFPPPPADATAFDDETAHRHHDDVAKADAPPAPPVGAEAHVEADLYEDPVPVAAPVIELRQIAGLTSGAIMELTQDTYDFAEGSESVGFSLSVDENSRVFVIPGAAPTTIDGAPIVEPTLLGSGVLDVGTARFIARPRTEQLSPTEHQARDHDIDQPDPHIIVPHDLVDVEEPDRRSRGLFRRKKAPAAPTDAANWEFMETIRDARSRVAARERHHQPDPTELALRVAHQAPSIGTRPFGHPLFATVSVMVADVPWLPDFDDIQAIPESVGFQLQPLLSLPSVPVVADLMVGPLGIVGPRAAAMACARHVLISLYAASTDDLRLHVVTAVDQRDAWAWSRGIAPAAPLAMADNEQSVVLIDGMELFGEAGFEHEDAIERRVSAVILADAVDQLPAYCGTVLQISDKGTGILTNHRGDMIHGTPIGISTAIAEGLAADLVPLVRQRQR